MHSHDCKMGRCPRGRRALRLGGMRLIAIAAIAPYCASCVTIAGRPVTPAALDLVPAVSPLARQRAIVCDFAELAPIYHPLNENLGMLEVRTARDWDCLRRAAPELRKPDNFSRGTLIAIISHCGTPVDGTWPVRITSVRARDGMGVMATDFTSGCFYPDAVTHADAAFIEGNLQIVAVDVCQIRYIPE